MIYFAISEVNRFVLKDYLATRGRPLAGSIRQVTYHDLFRRRSMPRGAWIFAALDTLSGAGRSMAECCWRAAADAGLPVLNRPSAALRRYELLESLYRAGMNQFRAVRAGQPGDSVRFPVFLREADEHSGNQTPLLRNGAELERAIAQMRKQGRDLGAHLIVEFCETAGPDGLYRKYAVYRVGDQYIPTHVMAGRNWMMKSAGQIRTQELAAEELDFVRTDPHGAWVREVFEIAHTDFGRIDYGVRDGKPQAWEINLCPMLTRTAVRRWESAEQRRQRALSHRSREISHAALSAAFERINQGPFAGEDVPVEFPRELEAEFHAEHARRRWERRRKLCMISLARIPALDTMRPMMKQAAGRMNRLLEQSRESS